MTKTFFNSKVDVHKLLVGYVPIKVARLLKNSREAKLTICTSNWKKEEGSWAVIPAKFTVFTCSELRIARILNRELDWRVVKDNHFKLKNIAFGKKNSNGVLLAL